MTSELSLALKSRAALLMLSTHTVPFVPHLATSKGMEPIIPIPKRAIFLAPELYRVYHASLEML